MKLNPINPNQLMVRHLGNLFREGKITYEELNNGLGDLFVWMSWEEMMGFKLE